MGTRHRLRRFGRTPAPPPERGRGRGTARLPRRPDPSHPPGGGVGRCRGTVALRGGARRQPASPSDQPDSRRPQDRSSPGSRSGRAEREATGPVDAAGDGRGGAGARVRRSWRNGGRALRVGRRAPGGCGTTAGGPGVRGAGAGSHGGSGGARRWRGAPELRRALRGRTPSLALGCGQAGVAPGLRRAERQRTGGHRGHQARDAGRTGPLQGHRAEPLGAVGRRTSRRPGRGRRGIDGQPARTRAGWHGQGTIARPCVGVRGSDSAVAARVPGG